VSAPANTVRIFEVTNHDLPLSCPGKFMTLWNMHPKVYLQFKGDQAACPYCGAKYQLKN